MHLIQLRFLEAHSKVDNPYSVTFLIRTSIRYVCVIWFVLHVLQLLPVRFTQQYLCCTNKSMLKHLQKLDWKPVLPLSSYGYRKCMFVDFIIGYISPPDCVHYSSVEQLLIFENILQSLLNLCLYDVCSRILTEPHTNQNTGIQLRKRATLNPSTLVKCYVAPRTDSKKASCVWKRLEVVLKIQ